MPRDTWASWSIKSGNFCQLVQSRQDSLHLPESCPGKNGETMLARPVSTTWHLLETGPRSDFLPTTQTWSSGSGAGRPSRWNGEIPHTFPWCPCIGGQRWQPWWPPQVGVFNIWPHASFQTPQHLWWSVMMDKTVHILFPKSIFCQKQTKKTGQFSLSKWGRHNDFLLWKPAIRAQWPLLLQKFTTGRIFRT